ncbi:methyltransferase domain-containing protein [Clostridia bacterium]|nr:methyltransferase domain-containing protein [Clostridia bacterium]
MYHNRKSLTNILDTAKSALAVSFHPNGTYADFTAGRGFDSLYIRTVCPDCELYSFDIQESAVLSTKKLLTDSGRYDDRVHIIRDSHADFAKYMTKLDGAIFNLGYLPRGDKSITTLLDSTMRCLTGALDMLSIGGVIVVQIYPGHEEGTREGNEILALAEKLDKKQFDCLYHRLVNIPEAPFIIAFQKKILFED